MLSRLPHWVIAGSCVFSLAANAATWVRDEGEAAFQAGLDLSTPANKYWDYKGGTTSYTCGQYSEKSVNVGMEYGYSYDYTLMASTSITQANCSGNTLTRPGAINFGVRGRFDERYNGESWELKLVIPGTVYPNGQPAAVGYGGLGLQVGAYFGTPYDPYNEDPYRPGFINPATDSWEYGGALTMYMGTPLPQVMGYTKWKSDLSPSWRVAAKLQADWTLGTRVPVVPVVPPLVPVLPEARVISTGLEFSHLLDENLVLSISPVIPLYGQNAPQSANLSIGVHKVFPR